MRKIFLIITVIIIFAVKAFPQMEIRMDCTETMGPGRYSKVVIQISFESTDGFARFTQDLPVGFEIVKDDLPSGDFSWNGSQLNVVWMKIPDSGKIGFSYCIKPDNLMQGKISLGGKIVRVTGGTERTSLELKEREISIGGTGGLLPGEIKKESGAVTVTNVTNQETKPAVSPAAGEQDVVYRVQVSTSVSELSGDAMKKKLGLVSKEKVTIIKSGGVYKYQLGEFRDKGAAAKLQKELAAKGIRDAFVVTGR